MPEAQTPKPYPIDSLQQQLADTLAYAEAEEVRAFVGRDESDAHTLVRLQRQLDVQAQWLGFLIQRVGELEADVYGGETVSGGDAGSPFHQ